jgi:hypothetical protein
LAEAVWGTVLTATYISTGIAGFALLLGLFNSYFLWRDRHPRLKVSGSYGVIAGIADPLYIVSISNPPSSNANVTITSIEIGIKGGQSLVYGGMLGLGDSPSTLTPLPHTLEPGDSSTHWVEDELLQDDLKEQGYADPARVTLMVKDASDKYHKKRVNVRITNPS